MRLKDIKKDGVSGVFYELEDYADFYGELLTLEDFKKILKKDTAEERDIIRFAAEYEATVIRRKYIKGIQVDWEVLYDPSAPAKESYYYVDTHDLNSLGSYEADAFANDAEAIKWARENEATLTKEEWGRGRLISCETLYDPMQQEDKK